MTGERVVALLLAGGRARRMGGGDKCLLPLKGRPLLAHVVERVRPQADLILLNANGDLGRFRAFGLPAVADALPGFLGPLSGILAGLRWARERDVAWVASLATDTPFFPADLIPRLKAALVRERAELACAASGGRPHPVFGLWPTALTDALARYLQEEGGRKIDRFTARYRLAVVDYPTAPYDPFFNINTPEDLAQAERLAAEDAAP